MDFDRVTHETKLLEVTVELTPAVEPSRRAREAAASLIARLNKAGALRSLGRNVGTLGSSRIKDRLRGIACVGVDTVPKLDERVTQAIANENTREGQAGQWRGVAELLESKRLAMNDRGDVRQVCTSVRLARDVEVVLGVFLELGEEEL